MQQSINLLYYIYETEVRVSFILINGLIFKYRKKEKKIMT